MSVRGREVGAKKGEKESRPDAWREGKRGYAAGKDGEVRVGVNKLLETRREGRLKVGIADEFKARKCKICQGKVGRPMRYCGKCAYKKGLCQRCGKKVIDVKIYRQTD